ncbi:MAG TPA: bifunctional hydroxymethylpyrimidine kinase/phosphomethylpyrimidine kinase [Syntrophomonas sp.]|nr:bifunctional hydroxymethylpyrimidine kinase/phosphomethylpyrimidine kinase [Syntrophomonas sp.]
MQKVLTIAGSDCSGGAGIQADIKTITAHKMYAMSAITALTAQNTTGVYGVLEAGADFVGQQLDCIFKDIFPDAVKIGMVSDSGIIEIIAERLAFYGAKNIVLDPVMVSTSGSRLISKDAIETLKTKLFALADIATPNIREAECLCGYTIDSPQLMEQSAREICRWTKGAVLVKGGHLSDSADDFLMADGEGSWFRAPQIKTSNTHGTGCTLSSAIACNLAAGYGKKTSVENAKAYVWRALKDGLNLGRGNGPLNHCVDMV